MKGNVLIIRLATLEDADLLFCWANESIIRKMAFDSSVIVYEEHLNWFQGMQKETLDSNDKNYLASYERLKKLVEIQGLVDTVRIHKLDLSTDLPDFFIPSNIESNVKYKYVFVDCGIKEVLEPVMEYFGHD